MTKKISSSDIKREIDAGEGLGCNPNARYLFQLLAAARGFGDRANKLKGLANEMYVNEATERNTFSTEPRLETDTRNKGDTRLGKLARGHGSFTPMEAKLLHNAFVKVFGYEWGELILPDKLVLGDIRETLREAISRELPWPDGLSIFSTFELLGLADSNVNPKLSFVEAGRFNVMSSGEGENADLFSLETAKRLQAGDRVFLQASEIPEYTKEIFIFIAADTPLETKDSNQHYGILPFGVRTFGGSHTNLFGPKPGSSFKVEAVTGRFCMGLICSSNESQIQDLLPKVQNQARWTMEESQVFLRTIRQQRLDSSSNCTVSICPYVVA